MIYDVIVDTLFEENLQAAIKAIGAGRLVMDSEDPESPYLTPDEGYLVVRLKTDDDPYAYTRELERRASNMRVISIVNRTPGEEPVQADVVPIPGSYAAQRANGLV